MKKTFFALLITLLSCQKQNIIKEYYDNGKIKMECETNNGLKNGKMIEYYPNGNVKTQSNWVNDTINGYSVGYYEFGNIEFISSWLNGELHGDYVKYDENGNHYLTKTYYYNKVDGYESIYDKGVLKQLCHYVIVGDSSYLNQFMNYDDFGNIKKENSQYYIILYSGYDTVQLNQSVNIKLLLSRVVHKNSLPKLQFVTGEFDAFFNILDRQSIDTVSVNNDIGLTFSFDKTGNQSIKGIILFSYFDTDNNLKHEKMYFAKPFFVKE